METDFYRIKRLPPYIFEEVNRLFEDFFRGFGVPALAGVERGLLAPSVELAETDKEIRLVAGDQRSITISAPKKKGGAR